MKWQDLNSEEQLMEINAASFQQPVVLFKHSTRCIISSMAKQRLERSDIELPISFYLLDLLNHRALSNKIAENYQVAHQSPQILLIKNGECIYENSHNGIDMQELSEQL